MELKHKDFVLRPALKSDLDSYYKNKKKDRDIEKGFFNYKYPYSYAAASKDLKRAIESKRKKDSEFFIIDIDGEVAGEIIYERIIPNLSAKVGYWLGKDFRRKGIMIKAMKLLNDYMIKKYKLRRLYGNVRSQNKASIKVLEKLNFKLEGVQRKAGMKNGKYFDDCMYAKVK